MNSAMLTLFSVLLIALSRRGAVGARAPAPSPGGAFAALHKCPSSPLEMCDFYVGKNRNTLPVLKVFKSNTDAILDYNSLWSGVTLMPVASASSYGHCYFVPEGPHVKCGTSFYFKGNPSALFSRFIAERTVVNLAIQNYAHKCVIIPVATAKIVTVYATKTKPAQYAYINSNDHNQQYPQSRRCIVFNTTI